MRAFLKHVARRVVLVAFCLAVGLFGWPGDVGAQSMIQIGNIESSGARRIRIQPNAVPESPEKTGEATAQTRTAPDGEGVGKRVTVPAKEPETAPAETAGHGTQIDTADRSDEMDARAALLARMASAPEVAETVQIPPAETILSEFQAPRPARTPYELSIAALGAGN